MLELIALIATIFLPPLGVAMKKGLGSDFWINLILTLILYVPGLIHGIYVNYVRGGGRAVA
ncbi:MAG: YqaE/Pmp3 family membrane protein [Pseudomonadota bacterium]